MEALVRIKVLALVLICGQFCKLVTINCTDAAPSKKKKKPTINADLSLDCNRSMKSLYLAPS